MHWSFSIPIFLLAGLPALILMIRLHVIGFIWFFQVPVRRKVPIYFRSLWAAFPWFAGFAILGFITDILEPYLLEAFVGLLALTILGVFNVGLFMHGKRWLDLMLEEGWMGTLGAKREKIWTISLSAGLSLLVIRELLSMHS